MQSVKRLVFSLGQNGRTYSTQTSWYFAKQTAPMTEAQLAKEQKQAKKEMIGVYLTAPIGVAAMFYDFIWGLESHDTHKIPPYPWMRNRYSTEMPWGSNGLFEFHPMVATTWPLEEGEEEAHH